MSVDRGRHYRLRKPEGEEIASVVGEGLAGAVKASGARKTEVSLRCLGDALKRYWLAWNGEKRALWLQDTKTGAVVEIVGSPACYAFSGDTELFVLRVESAFVLPGGKRIVASR